MKRLLAVWLTAYSSLTFADGISFSNAYIPLMPQASNVYAAYMSISNVGEQARKVVGVSAEGFAMAHIHQSMIKHGVASMHSMHELNVPAGETVTLVSGGIHVMLMKPDVAFIRGDTVMIQFMFADGEVATVEATLGKLN